MSEIKNNLQFKDDKLHLEDEVVMKKVSGIPVNQEDETGTIDVDANINIGGSASINGDVTVKGSVTIEGTSYKVIENPEYVWAIIDNDDKILCGIKTDGKFAADIDGIDEKFQEAINQMQTIIDAAQASIDEKIAAIDEKFDFISWIEDPEGRSEITTDAEGKIISYRDSDGTKVEKCRVKFEELAADKIEFNSDNLDDIARYLQEQGYLNTYDNFIPKILVTSEHLTVSGDNIEGLDITKNEVECKIAVITPTVKFLDEECLIAYQGNSTLSHPKKGFTFDFSKKYRFGDWLAFDSFHCKGYYADWLHLRDWLSNKIIEQMYNLRNEEKIRPYSQYNDFALNNVASLIECGPLCHTDEFPVELFINGSYWGLYSLRIKKSRDNYMLTKKDVHQIQVEAANDAYYTDEWFADGGQGWGTSISGAEYIEIRNPSKDSANSKFNVGVEPKKGEVKIAWQSFISKLNSVTSNTTVQELETFLNIDEWVDAILFYHFVNTGDCWCKNTLYTCWDSNVDVENESATGHWSPLLYDFDGTFYGPAGDTYTAKAYDMCPWLSTVMEILSDKLISRYKELRDNKVFDADNIRNLIISRTQQVGKDVYERDIERWNYPSILDDRRAPSLTGILLVVRSIISYMDNRYNYNQN